MSQKRIKGVPTRGEGMVMTYREATFAIVSAASKILKESISASFERTKYGSRRNAFFKANYDFLRQLGESPIKDASSSSFTEALIGYGMQEGQTIVAAMQAGIINTDALEAAMAASNANGTYNFMAVKEWAQSTSASIYVRIKTDGEFKTANYETGWSIADDPMPDPKITSMVGTTSGAGQNMVLSSVTVTGENLESLKRGNAIVQMESVQVQGTWNDNGDTFTATGQNTVYSGTNRIYIKYDGVEIARTAVYNNGTSGE